MNSLIGPDTSMTIRVRNAITDDLSALLLLSRQIQKLHADLYPDEFSSTHNPDKTEKFYKKLITSKDQFLFVAEYEQRVCGYLWCETFSKGQSLFSAPKNYLYIQHICVDNSAKRQGIGTALFRELEDLAVKTNVGEIKLNTWFLNKTAQAFFKARGFEPYRIDMKKKL